MENLKQWIEGKKKVPKCVDVYNKLFKLINEGEFENEDKLPSEPVLAELMGVSRMTLRQAISLLQDDGIIKKIQGKGNFFIRNSKKIKRGLELLQHPIHTSIIYEIEEVEIDFNVQFPSDYTRRILGENHSAALFVDRWYKKSGINVAYTLTMLPIELIMEKKINIENKEELLKFLEESVYLKPNISKIKIKFTKSMKFVSAKDMNTTDKRSFLLEEIITCPKNTYFIHNKHYIPINNSNLLVERK